VEYEVLFLLAVLMLEVLLFLMHQAVSTAAVSLISLLLSLSSAALRSLLVDQLVQSWARPFVKMPKEYLPSKVADLAAMPCLSLTHVVLEVAMAKLLAMLGLLLLVLHPMVGASSLALL